MNILTAMLLGAVQGVTEFLPISSSGHLVLFETLLGLNAESPEMLLFDLATHVGTVVAVLVVFRRSLFRWTGRGGIDPHGCDALDESEKPLRLKYLALMVVAANVATGSLVLPFKKLFTDARGSIILVAAMWVVTGTLLWLTDKKGKAISGLMEFGLKGALIVGLAQGVAVLPGISRSGATIGVAVLIGLKRARAVEFSMLIGVPAILGAALLETIGNRHAIDWSASAAWPMLAGGLVAAVVGVGALKLLIVASRQAKLRYFGFYCYLMSAVALAVGLFQQGCR